MTDTPYGFESKLSLPMAEKIPLLSRDGHPFHVLFAEQFDKEEILRLCSLADIIRQMAADPKGSKFLRGLLPHKSAMLYFTQPSTRTYLSFVRACQYLGMPTADVRDPRISSAYKGESDMDGARTFSSYSDLLIMRHSEAGFAERVAYMLNEIDRPIPLISGGAGMDQHPTQALLDVYTLHRALRGKLQGMRIAFVGDLKRGRTVRSLAKLLALWGARMTFVSPPNLHIKEDLREYLRQAGIKFTETSDLRGTLGRVNAIYMTRIQDEYDGAGESTPRDYPEFSLKVEDVELTSAVILHPFPRRGEIDPAIDSHPAAHYWRQERNGMWMRAALICRIFGLEETTRSASRRFLRRSGFFDFFVT